MNPPPRFVFHQWSLRPLALAIGLTASLAALSCTSESTNDDPNATAEEGTNEANTDETNEPTLPAWVGSWTVDTEASLAALDEAPQALRDLTRSIYDGTRLSLSAEHYAATVTVLGEERTFRFPMTVTTSGDTYTLEIDMPDGPRSGSLTLTDEARARLITPDGDELVLIRDGAAEDASQEENTEEVVSGAPEGDAELPAD